MLAHRYVGLAIAVFVAVAGLTGSVLAYFGPLQQALVPPRFVASARGPVLAPSELSRRVEAHAPLARITRWPLRLEAGRPAAFNVEPAPGGSNGQPQALGFDTVHVDPVSGEVLGRSGPADAQPMAARVLDFLYELHYSLALGRWGIWIMGIAALLWFFDCFVGAWLTFPRGRPFLRKWVPAWQVQGKRLNFDLHRALGLWFFGVLAVLALSSVQLNLNDEVFMPVARRLLTLSAEPLAGRSAAAGAESAAPRIGIDRANAVALTEAAARGWPDRPDLLLADEARGLYQVVFAEPAEAFSPTRRQLYLDDRSGAVLLAQEPNAGTAGDTALSWLTALHLGRVLGWPYKLLLCLTGLAVATLSVTGAIVWWRKLKGRRRHVGNKNRSH